MSNFSLREEDYTKESNGADRVSSSSKSRNPDFFLTCRRALGAAAKEDPQKERRLKLELYLPYAPLPGGGGILPAVSSSVGGGGCRPVLLGGVDLSMSAAVQSASNIVPPSHNSLHPPVGLAGGGGGGGGGSGSGPPLPSLNNGPTLMSRGPPPVTIQPLGSSLAPVLHHDDPDITDAPPNPDVLLALLARNKNLEGK
ncbi:hypothetical protein PV325_013381 [Microctonus aethiopoides]|nr:hypothetical protein PV325_013381 [Microctonus aethiopoides]